MTEDIKGHDWVVLGSEFDAVIFSCRLKLAGGACLGTVSVVLAALVVNRGLVSLKEKLLETVRLKTTTTGSGAGSGRAVGAGAGAEAAVADLVTLREHFFFFLPMVVKEKRLRWTGSVYWAHNQM